MTLPGLEPRPLSRPASSQSLYHCVIPAHHGCENNIKMNLGLIGRGYVVLIDLAQDWEHSVVNAAMNFRIL
jgi:hypothetical protein